jgi:hypothetical protein
LAGARSAKVRFDLRRGSGGGGAIFDSLVAALQEGEWVQTPLGEFQIKRRTKPYQRVRFKKVQTLHYQSKRVVFKAAAFEGGASQ